MFPGHFNIFGHMDNKNENCSEMGLQVQLIPETFLDWITVLKYDFLVKK